MCPICLPIPVLLLCGIQLKHLLTRQHKAAWKPDVLQCARVGIRTALEGIRPPRLIGYSNSKRSMRVTPSSLNLDSHLE